MFPGGRVTTPSTSLPAGWTAYTDVKTSQTYYVHLPTGDTQWNRPPPPPPPPPRPPQPNPTHPSARIHPFACSMYTVPATIPHSFQFQSRPVPSSACMLSNGGGSGINTNRLSYHPNSNQTTLPPLPPPTSSFNSISTSQSKRSLAPTHHAPKPPPTKRPRVQQTKSHANLITPVISNNSGKWKECSKCKLKKEWMFFTKKQWQSGVSGKCKQCVEEMVVDEIERSRAATKAAKLSSAAKADINNTTTECFRVPPTPATAKKSSGKKVNQPPPKADGILRVCSSCQQWGGKHLFFSKRQWPCHDDVRKCKQCVKISLPAKSSATSSVFFTGKDVEEGADANCSMHGSGENNTQTMNNPLGSLSVPGVVVVKQEKSS
jgi:hypothetical protein